MVKPNVIMSFGFLLIIATGILGEYFSWDNISYKPVTNIIGSMLFVTGFLLHLSCHKYHKNAHEKSSDINKIIVSGPFSIIRHPMYLSLIIMYIGLFITWGIVWMLIPAIFFSIITIIVSLKEERFLINKLGSQYEDYMQRVPWRFIPKVF